MTEPLVSVIIPCYNQGRFLAEAIESALGQTYPNVEVIVVNDGSTDETAEVAARYAGRIKYIEQENAGVSVARNRGILESRGEFLQFLDADDRILPTKLVDQLRAFADHPEVGVVYSEGRYIDETGREIGAVPLNHATGDVFHKMLSLDQTVIHAPLLRRSCLASAGLFEPGYPAAEDAAFWLKVAATSLFLACPEIHFEYRVRRESRSRDWRAVLEGHLQVIRTRPFPHSHCAHCRRAAHIGTRRWVNNASFELIMEAKSLWQCGRRLQAMRNVVFVLRHNPAHVRHLLAPRYFLSKAKLVLGKPAQRYPRRSDANPPPQSPAT